MHETLKRKETYIFIILTLLCVFILQNRYQTSVQSLWQTKYVGQANNVQLSIENRHVKQSTYTGQKF